MNLKSLNNFSFLSPLPFFYLYLFKYLSTSKPIFLSSSVSLFLLLLILCKCSISLQTTSSKTCKLICRQRFIWKFKFWFWKWYFLRKLHRFTLCVYTVFTFLILAANLFKCNLARKYFKFWRILDHLHSRQGYFGLSKY